LFEEPATSALTLSEEYTQDIPQLTQEENNIVVAEFTEKEVKDAIFQIELNKLEDLMVFQLSSTKPSGKLLRVI
jgi:hypothetical protein